MLVKLLSNQIPDYEELINKAIKESIPPCEPYGVSLLYKELLMDYAQAWIYTSNDEIQGITISRITDDSALGGRVMTILAAYAVKHLTEEVYYESYCAVKEYAKAHDCNLMAFYTNSERLIEMTKLLNIKHKTMFMIASFDEN